MFLRKLLKSDSKPEVRNGPPAGMQAMGANLQRKFAKGIQYNMKIIIKGDRNVGKSCLLQRLQGQKFKEEYIPTDEIQVANIQWSYKATNDVVKVEVWDVVDKGKKKKKLDGLKLEMADSINCEDPCLDADFVDVYKSTHGIIVVMDITKQWTFEYVERELPKMPAHVPVLILANHRDMGHHRTITEDQVRSFIEHLERPADAAQVRYVETSMRTGFGLKYIHKFFNLPFLHLQRETLLRQLETNTFEMQLTFQELDLHEESDEQDYDLFLDALTNKRREQQELLAEAAIREAAAKRREELAAAAAAAATAQQNGAASTTAVATAVTSASGSLTIKEAPPPRPIPGLNLSAPKSKPTSISPSASATNLPSVSTSSGAIGSKSVPATPAATPVSEKSSTGFMSRIFGSNKPTATTTNNGQGSDDVISQEQAVASSSPVRNVDEFTPEESLDASFLEDVKETKAHAAASNTMMAVAVERHSVTDSDDDAVGVNPLVAGFQDDLDSDDEQQQTSAAIAPTIMQPQTVARHQPTTRPDVDLSSDDDNNPSLAPASQSSKVQSGGQSAGALQGAIASNGHKSTQKSVSSSTSVNTSNTATAGGIDWSGGSSLMHRDRTKISPAKELVNNGGGLNHIYEVRDTDRGRTQMTEKSSSKKEEVRVKSSDGDDDDDDDEARPAVLQGLEDLSEEEGEVVKNKNKKSPDVASPQPLYTLNFDDLDLLEKRYDANRLQIGRSQSSRAISGDADIVSSGSSSGHIHKKKHKSKESSGKTDSKDGGGEKRHSEKKHRSNREHRYEGREEAEEGDRKERKEKSSKKHKETKSKKDAGDGGVVEGGDKKKKKAAEVNDLEAFLGSTGPYESL